MPFGQKVHDFWRHWIWRNFVLYLSLVVISCVIGFFIWMFVQDKQLLLAQVERRAKSLLAVISLMWQWNAANQGVWIEKRPGVFSDYYLPHPDLQTRDGRTLTQRTPVRMLDELALQAQSYNLFYGRVVSSDPLNPAHYPDLFEANALAAFREGHDDFFGLEEKDGRFFFRALRPLWVEEGCLRCHAQQNFQLGEIRGALSIRFEITDLMENVKSHKRLLILLSLAAVIALLAVIYFLIARLMRRINEVQRQLVELATIDDLTKLHNRRYFYYRFGQEMERTKRYQRPISCLILDLDDFKKINDSYGHLVGDQTLREVAAIVRENCRVADLAARYGGEEFIVLLPETDPEGARVIAERLRNLIASHQFQTPTGQAFGITASCGVASLVPAELAALGNHELLIQAADDALYQAKNQGKNRCIVAPVPVAAI